MIVSYICLFACLCLRKKGLRSQGRNSNCLFKMSGCSRRNSSILATWGTLIENSATGSISMAVRQKGLGHVIKFFKASWRVCVCFPSTLGSYFLQVFSSVCSRTSFSYSFFIFSSSPPGSCCSIIMEWSDNPEQKFLDHVNERIEFWVWKGGPICEQLDGLRYNHLAMMNSLNRANEKGKHHGIRNCRFMSS